MGCGNDVHSQQVTENLIVPSAKASTSTKREGNESFYQFLSKRGLGFLGKGVC